MIGSVDLCVAVQTALTQQELRRHPVRQARCVEGDAGVTVLRVTTLAKQRCTLCEHARLIGAMGRMAETAVFRSGCMLPEMRASRFGVALVAGIDGRELRELRGCCVAMHRMAARAVHLLLDNRVCESFLDLRAHSLVAVDTNRRLTGREEDRISGLVA